jgi:hypothetical protein
MLHRDLHKNPQDIVSDGSDNFSYNVPSLAHGATAWFDVESLVRDSRLFLPLDSLEIVNNTMCLLTLYFNSPAESYTIAASMIKTINKPYRRLGIKNNDPSNAAAAIVLHMRRLPSQGITKIVQG